MKQENLNTLQTKTTDNEAKSSVDCRVIQPNSFINGDCMEFMRTCPPNFFDLAIVDPPYGINYSAENMGLKTSNNFDVIINDESDATELVKSCFYFKCKKIIFGANNFMRSLPHKGVWHCWDKRSNHVNDLALADGAIGSMFELAWVDKQNGYQAIFRIKHGGAINADGGKRAHPTQKPTQLIVDLMEHEKAENKIVDLFGGSGSTLIACEKTNRKCYMMELDPRYVDVIIARWENYTGRKAQLHEPS